MVVFSLEVVIRLLVVEDDNICPTSVMAFAAGTVDTTKGISVDVARGWISHVDPGKDT